MNYSNIKRLAKERKTRITNLIALAPQNDPFYTGQPAQVEAGRWFASLWEQSSYSQGVHLRRVHYQIISQEQPIKMPNSKPYENTTNCWAYLDLASKAARYLELIDPAAFDDRRNSRPIINTKSHPECPFINIEQDLYRESFDFPDFPDLPEYEVQNYAGQQKYHLEIWSEKSTMNDILEPLCQNYHVNLITGVGELSITHVVWLIERLKTYQKPCRIFYVSDFDPAGQSMPLAVARKIEYFLSKEDGALNADVKLFPLVLTKDQCERYQLPRTPIRKTERRARAFEERYGEGATELDALEALYPGELYEILQSAILQYFDVSLDDEVEDARDELTSHLEEIRDDIVKSYQTDIDDLKEQYERLKAEYKLRTETLITRIENLWQAIMSLQHENVTFFAT